MTKTILVLAGLILAMGPLLASAQSLIQLPPSIDLGAPPGLSTATPLSPQGCRPGSVAGCTGRPAAVGFSLADVVNLGIIDRQEAASVLPTGEGASAATMAQPLPSVDLEVLFDYNSDSLRPDQLPQLTGLANQLRGIDMTQAFLIVMGHTDAVGGAAYNDDLSLRRARTVAWFLRDSVGLPDQRIRASGQGFRYLKYPEQPTHGANRRVQIILAAQGG